MARLISEQIIVRASGGKTRATAHANKDLKQLVTAVSTSKPSGQLDSHQKTPGSENEDAGCLIEVEISDVAHKQVSKGQIESAPQHVDRWRRLSLAGRGSKWRWEPTPGHAVREVRNGVHEKSAAQEVSEIRVPLHDSSFDTELSKRLEDSTR